MPGIYSIGFYNLENLFDHRTYSSRKDADYTSGGYFSWNQNRYRQKIENLSEVISQIGSSRSASPPVVMGVCEVENEACMDDLVNSKSLKPYNYDYVFSRSSDPRGINVALMYRKEYFNPVSFKSYSIENIEEKTRDILTISGILFGQSLNILVNHWPSRAEGIQKTNDKRIQAAKLARSILSEIYMDDEKAEIIILGDFNDDPESPSIRQFLSKDLINPMKSFQKSNLGSVKFKGRWKAFDQIILNSNLIESSWFEFNSAHIFCKPYLTQKNGKYKGSPKRTFIGNHYLGGYSDHYPVFIYFQG